MQLQPSVGTRIECSCFRCQHLWLKVWVEFSAPALLCDNAEIGDTPPFLVGIVVTVDVQ